MHHLLLSSQTHHPLLLFACLLWLFWAAALGRKVSSKSILSRDVRGQQRSLHPLYHPCCLCFLNLSRAQTEFSARFLIFLDHFDMFDSNFTPPRRRSPPIVSASLRSPPLQPALKAPLGPRHPPGCNLGCRNKNPRKLLQSLDLWCGFIVSYSCFISNRKESNHWTLIIFDMAVKVEAFGLIQTDSKCVLWENFAPKSLQASNINWELHKHFNVMLHAASCAGTFRFKLVSELGRLLGIQDSLRWINQSASRWTWWTNQNISKCIKMGQT